MSSANDFKQEPDIHVLIIGQSRQIFQMFCVLQMWRNNRCFRTLV